MYRLLIIDDELLVGRALQRTMQREGWEILSANSGEHALEFLAQSDASSDFGEYGIVKVASGSKDVQQGFGSAEGHVDEPVARASV